MPPPAAPLQRPPVDAEFRPWFDAWVDAAFGDGGFWRRSRVGDHFRTASGTGRFAAAIARLVRSARPEIATVLEIGAGDGRLLAQLRTLLPDHRLIGVDLRPPAVGLHRVDWRTGLWDVGEHRWRGEAAATIGGLGEPTMIICAEWLDDLPCRIATATGDPTAATRPAGGGRSSSTGRDGSRRVGRCPRTTRPG